MPFEVIGGDTEPRRASWHVSNCPLKLVNYELLTRDAELRRTTSRCTSTWSSSTRPSASRTGIEDGPGRARHLRRDRSWAMTGTPIENRADDLVNIFAFVDPDRIPPDTPPKLLPRADERLHPAPHQGRGRHRHAAARSSRTSTWN